MSSTDVKPHDLIQLRDLGLVQTADGPPLAFWPTPFGRHTVADPAGALEGRADTKLDRDRASKLTEWAPRLRVGDLTVGAGGSLLGQAIRVLVELAT